MTMLAELAPEMLVSLPLRPDAIAPPAAWNLGTRIAFRFSVAYFGLYVIATQMLSSLLILPGVGVPQIGEIPPLRNLTAWTAAHVFGVTQGLVITGSGSGDKTYDWSQAIVFLAMAIVATMVWSVADHKRTRYPGLLKWFRLFLRFALGSTMLSYAMVKVIPLQMSAPSMTRLLEPYGNFSPMGVLWASVGASRGYEIIVGCAELAGAILLFIPRTALLGALVCLADTIEIFTLNMTYDVPVKLFAFHLILFSLVLLAPEMSRLANVLLLDRTARPSTQPPLARSRRMAIVLVAAQALFGAYLIGMNLSSAQQAWKTYGGGAPKSPLYGIWNVDEMRVDGQIRSPLLTDYGRWRRVLFQSPAFVSFERMDDTFAGYAVTIDMAARSLTLTKASDKAWKAHFAFQQPDPAHLVLDGQMDGRPVQMRLALFDRNTLLLVSRGFHWIQEFPFNR